MVFDINKIKLPAQKLNELKVGLVYLFGSEAEGTAGPLSDVDIELFLLIQKSLAEIRRKYTMSFIIF